MRVSLVSMEQPGRLLVIQGKVKVSSASQGGRSRLGKRNSHIFVAADSTIDLFWGIL